MKTVRRQIDVLAALACTATLLTLFSLAAGRVWSEEPDQPSADEAAIRKTVEGYVQAFGKHDAKALADLWSPEAVYTNRFTGEQAVGRAAIAEQFTALFKEQPELK